MLEQNLRYDNSRVNEHRELLVLHCVVQQTYTLCYTVDIHTVWYSRHTHCVIQ